MINVGIKMTTWFVAVAVVMFFQPLIVRSQNCRWRQYNDTNIFGGKAAAAAASLADCEMICLSTDGCESIDWAPGNPSGEKCFLLTRKSEKFTTPNVTHYDLDCNENCTYERFGNTTVSGGSANGAISLRGCQLVCQIEASCQGITWVHGESIGKQCYLLLFSVQTNQVSATPSVDYYVLRCGTTTSSVKMTPTRSASTSAETIPVNPRNCRTTYEISPMTSSVGGALIPEIKDPFQCGATCTFVKSCIGIDFSSTSGCWIHFNESTFDKKYYQTNVTQIKINRCPDEGIVKCYESRDANNVINDSCATVCYPKWTRFENTGSSEAQPTIFSNVNNLTECLKLCFNRSNCIGVEWSQVPGMSPSSTCALYDSSQQAAFTTTIFKPFVTQYRLVSSCGTSCITKWILFNNTAFRTAGHTIRLNVATAAECERACRLSKTCVLYEFTKTGPIVCTLADDYFPGTETFNSSVATYVITQVCNETFLQPTPTPPTQPSSKTSVSYLNGSSVIVSSTEFTTKTMTTRDPCVWIQFNNINIFGGNLTNATTLAVCQSMCRNISRCQGIDWSLDAPVGSQCYLHSTQNSKNSANWNVIHFDLNCSNAEPTTLLRTLSSSASTSTTITQSVSTSTSRTTLSTTSTNSNSSQSVCSWNYQPNSFIYQGQEHAARTLADCQFACVSNSTCRGIDWSRSSPPGQQCYLHRSQDGKYRGSEVDHYDLNCRINCTFTAFQDLNIFGGILNEKATTLSGCQRTCLLTPDCKGIDWVPAEQQCYILEVQNNKSPFAGVTHYDLTC